MLAELKFVMGAVARKDLVPAMTHFAIKSSRIKSFNGTVALSSPIPFDIDCNPRAESLFRAIEQCEEAVTLYMTPGGKLGVKSGSFRSLVPCIEDNDIHPEPEGEFVDVDGEVLLKAFKVLEPVIGDDASRPWANGLLIKGQSAFATCNVMLVEYWLGVDFGRVVNVPAAAIREVLRINEAPDRAQVTENSISFHFKDGRWVRSQLFSTEWPNLSRVLDKGSNPTPIDSRIFVALEKLKKFTDKANRVYFEPGHARTHYGDDEGTRFDMEGSVIRGIYNREILKLMEGLADTADFTTYPKPCLFYGDRLRGAIIGMAA